MNHKFANNSLRCFSGRWLMLLTVLTVISAVVISSVQPVEAKWANAGSSTCATSGCHPKDAVIEFPAVITVAYSINGAASIAYAGGAIAINAGDTIEVDWKFTNLGFVNKLGAGVHLPTGWTPSPGSTVTSAVPSWVSAAWDQSAGGTWDAAILATENVNSPDGYLLDFTSSGYGNASPSLADDGAGTDLDGIPELMGMDVSVTIPGGATTGTYEIEVFGAGKGKKPTKAQALKASIAQIVTLDVTGGGGDSTAPIANNDVVVSPESTTFVPADFTVTATFTDAESAVTTCDYTLNGGGAWVAGVVSGAGPYTCTANVAGQTDTTALTINTRATSSGGGPTVSTAINRTVDAAAPTTTDNVPAGWQTADVTVTLTPADAGSGVASTDYCVDQADICVPGTAYGAPFIVSTEGNNFVRYTSTDNLSNVQTVVSKTLDIDKTAPTDGALTPTPGNIQIALSWTAATDAASGLTSPAYKVVMATGTTTPPADCSAAGIYTGDALTHTELSLTNGLDYAFRVCAYDVAGLVSTGATGTAQPVAGNTAPTVPTNPAQYQSNGTTVISVGGFATATTVVFEGDLSDPDADTVKLQIDYTGDNVFDCETALVASGTANVQVSCPGLTDGNGYDWQFRAVDSNAAASAWTDFNAASPDFSVDATAPSVTSTVPINTATGISTNSQVTINFSENIDCTTVNTTNITIDSGGWTLNSCSAAQAIFDTSTQIATTAYAVSVTSAVTDPAGNALSPAPYNFSYTTGAVVNNAPTVVGSLAQYEDDGTTPIAGGGNSATNSVVIEAQIDDSDGDVLILEVDIDSDGNPDCVSPAVTGSGTPQALCTALVDGAYDWQVRAKDDQGATSGWSPLGGSPDFNIVAGVDIGVDITPPIESGLALAPGDSIIDLTWNPADDGAGSGLDPVNTYKVARSTVATPVDCDTGNIYTGNINAYSDTTVSNGTTYYYLVCAYDVLGNGSTGQAASAAPGSACTYNLPTVSILTASKDITNDGGFVDYTIQVNNTDVGACVATDFDLVLVDDNGVNFYASTFGVDPLNVSGGGSAQTTIRVTAQANQPNTSANNSYFYTAADGNHAQSANSNTVTSTINVSGGGCVSTGSYVNGSGDQLILSR